VRISRAENHDHDWVTGQKNRGCPSETSRNRCPSSAPSIILPIRFETASALCGTQDRCSSPTLPSRLHTGAVVSSKGHPWLLFVAPGQKCNDQVLNASLFSTPLFAPHLSRANPPFMEDLVWIETSPPPKFLQ